MDDAVNEQQWLAERFDKHRVHLGAVAYRMLGSTTEADDAVQEAWLRLSRSNASEVNNLGGWLTTVVARVCLDMLRSRTTRHEAPLDVDSSTVVDFEREIDPEQQVVLADSMGVALLVVLDTLTPAERVAFVLHDMFGVPFDEIATIVGRSPAATRQLASRARGRVRGATADPATDQSRQREVVRAFLAASRNGDFAALLAMLDPDVVLRADAAAIGMGATTGALGAMSVAETFAGRAKGAQLAVANGVACALWAPGGRPRVVFEFTVDGGVILAIDIVADSSVLDELDFVIDEDDQA